MNLVGTNNNWVSMKICSTDSIIVLNSIGELYNVTYQGNIKKIDASDVKYYAPLSVYTDSGFLYVNNNGELFYIESSYTTKVKLTTNVSKWSYIVASYANTSSNYTFYGIGDKKLYKGVISGSNVTLTQIGTETNYCKLVGGVQSAIGWTGSATSVSHTVYTTAHPQSGDKTYSDTNLTEYSTISSVSGTTITDQYRTYNMDVSKNGSFTSIPPASIHETVTVADILRATQ